MSIAIGEDPAGVASIAAGIRGSPSVPAHQAVTGSGILEHVDPTRLGVYLGSGEGQQDFESFTRMMTAALRDDGLDVAAFTKQGLEILHPMAELEQEPNMPAGHLARVFNAQGPNANCLTACAASSQAIGEAVELIRRGDAEAMLSGGTHSMIHPFGVTGFNLLTALSTRNDEPQRASRPFDRDRDGFVLGEGAAAVVLEELEHATARNAPIYGEVLGYGSTADAYRITDAHPEGRGAIQCIQLALADAELEVDQIDYINAHGTSTSVNDRVESLAIKRVFGERAVSDSRLEHQEHAGASDRRGRCHRADHLPDGDPARGAATDDQLRKARSRLRPGLRAQRGP